VLGIDEIRRGGVASTDVVFDSVADVRGVVM
jgi:hypothetical protein